MIRKELCKADADRIFQEKAVLIGESDKIPMIDIVEMFGEDALRFAVDMDNREERAFTKSYYFIDGGGSRRDT